MRTSAWTILALSVLAACATSPPGEKPPRAEDWQALQQQRLQTLHGKRDPVAALVALREFAPGRPQEPRVRHIDQREPSALGVGPRRFQGSSRPMVARVDAGTGRMALKAPGTMLDDSVGATFVRVSLDTATNDSRGGAIIAKFAKSDDDLFAGTLISDGLSPAFASATATSFDLFPHVRIETLDRLDFELPIRAGLFLDWLLVDHHAAVVERSMVSLGPRIMVEPRWNAFQDSDQRFDVFLRLSADVGAAWFKDRFRGGQGTDTTIRGSGSAGLGMHYVLGRLHTEAGYEVGQTWYGGTDTELFGDRSSLEVSENRWFFGLGVRF